MFELNQEVWCYLDDLIPVVKGRIMDVEPYITKEHNDRVMTMYKVKWNRYGSSYFEECDIYTDEATLRERLDKEAEMERMELLKEEYQLFLKMKKDYPKTLKDTTFDSEFTDSLGCLQSQINSGYLDTSDGNCNELAFKIMTEAFKLYKEKHGIK